MIKRARSNTPRSSRDIARRTAIIGVGAGLFSTLARPAAARMLPTLPKVLQRLNPTVQAPTAAFTTGDGQKLTLSAYRGRGVVLNLWATWCPPCKAEMPALDHLAQMVAGEHIAVLPVSINSGGRKAVAAFYQANRITHLPILLDPAGTLAAALKIPGIPTSVLLDAAGRMVGRVVGPAEWDAPASIALLRRTLGALT